MSESNVKLKVFRSSPEAKMPDIAYGKTSACFDLFSVETIYIQPRSSATIDTGIRFVIPDGWEITFRDRSSLGIKNDLHCHHGTIDAGYKGPVTVKFYNMGDKLMVINAGEKIIQCALRPVPKVEFEEIDEETFNSIDTLRGENGFGSSGK